MSEPTGGPPPAPFEELVAQVQAIVEGGVAVVPWTVIGAPPDDAEYEYVAVARIPDRDLIRRASSPLALARTTLVEARWSAARGVVDEEVGLVAKLRRPPQGKIEFDIFERDEAGEDDPVATIEAAVAGEEARARWKVVYVNDDDDVESAEEIATKGYTLPEFYFVVKEAGTELGSSPRDGAGLLHVLDVIDRVIMDEVSKKPAAGARYELELQDGSKRSGFLDGEGRLRLEGVAPGQFRVRLTGAPLRSEKPGPGPAPSLVPDGARMPPPAQDAPAVAPPPRPPKITGVTVAPASVEEGGEVTLEASLLHAPEGTEVRFLLFPLYQDRPIAEVRAPVAGGKARARWTVQGARNGRQGGGFRYIDVDVETRCAGDVHRSVGVPEFRAVAWED